MDKEIKNLLEKIAESESIELIEYRKESKKLLEEDLKKEVLQKFKYIVYDKESLANNDKIAFIYSVSYVSEIRKLLNDNFDKIDKIMQILKESSEVK